MEYLDAEVSIWQQLPYLVMLLGPIGLLAYMAGKSSVGKHFFQKMLWSAVFLAGSYVWMVQVFSIHKFH